MAFLVAAALARPASASADDGEVTLVAYNAQNFFDVFDDPFTTDEGTDVKPRDEIEAIARVLRRLDADVVAFSEIENEAVLRALVDELLGGMGYAHVAATPTNSGRGINLGVISRLPIEAVTSYRHRPLTLPGVATRWRFARDLMRVTLTRPDGVPMEVFVVHFKSKRDSDGDPESANWRLAEATAAGGIVEEAIDANPGRWVAMLGDFNDLPGSPPLRRLLAGGLADAHAGLPAGERITFLREPFRSTIDYVLVNAAMRDALIEATVPSDPALLEGSDHAPVVARFRVPG